MIRRWLSQLPGGSAKSDTPATQRKTLTTRDELNEALAVPVAVLYKHSPICAVSSRTLRQVKRFAREHPDTAVFHIDVIRHRDLSDWISEHFGVRHESPQALVVRDGREAWATSHSAITADALWQQVEKDV